MTKQTKRAKRAPRPDQLPGAVKYRPAKGKKSDRPLERIKQGLGLDKADR
jgi:hypothetical protein